MLNTATDASREAVTGSDGAGDDRGFAVDRELSGKRVQGRVRRDEVLKDITLRSGEAATFNVKLLVGSGTAAATIFGTAGGVRADAQIGRSFSSQQIDETPILGRKASSVPLLNSAFRQAKGTGDLFVNQTYSVTGAGSRRTATTTLDGGKQRRRLGQADGNRRSATGCNSRNDGPDERVLFGVRLDRGPGGEHRDKVRNECLAWRSALYEPPGRLAGEIIFDEELLSVFCVNLRYAGHAYFNQPGRRSGQAEPDVRIYWRSTGQR